MILQTNTPLRALLAGALLLSAPGGLPAREVSDIRQELANELALIEAWLPAQRAYDRVPGLSAAVVRDEQLLWSGASGFADLERRAPARDDTIYGICSISKLFTGIAVLQLRDRGQVNLDQPLGELLPWFRLGVEYENSPPVTLRNLLSHSSGLPRESDLPYWTGPDFVFPDRQQLHSLLAGQAALYPSDRYFQYSNLGLALAGEVVAEVSGQDYAGYVREQLLEPLRMRDTEAGFPTDERAARIATGYGFPGREGGAQAMPRYDTRAILPAAGYTSTALDLARFAAWQFALLHGEGDSVLQSNTLREMQRVQWMDWDWSVARGLGFGVYRDGDFTLTGHSGSCPGFNTQLLLDPVGHHAVVIMANRNNVDVFGYAMVLFELLEGGATPDPGAIAVDGLGSYLGSYDTRPWAGEDLVFRWGDGLALVSLPTMDPLGEMVELRQVDGDRFVAVRSDGSDGHEVMFLRDDRGAVSHLRYHQNLMPRLPR